MWGRLGVWFGAFYILDWLLDGTIVVQGGSWCLGERSSLGIIRVLIVFKDMGLGEMGERPDPRCSPIIVGQEDETANETLMEE